MGCHEPFNVSEASKFPDEQWDPMFTVSLAQKNHHPQQFQTKGPANVPPDGIRFPKSCVFNTPLYEQVVNEAPKLRYE
ncbi:protein argonaute 9-like [Brassica napus]|uniref:protein argonaute 9-like n=1 Tax=Brassica napus TaxID=3708 RepID=UPI0006AAE260|nr:protein argonaute 9-like [Brassica napus]XP_048595056.1 protein argonaute 9-like [Brassica napus]XP_048595057.1 protein argonaute 9-like [Brassica napus]XP_048595058.1 protein argonaute 9-like [Brassica napus]